MKRYSSRLISKGSRKMGGGRVANPPTAKRNTAFDAAGVDDSSPPAGSKILQGCATRPPATISNPFGMKNAIPLRERGLFNSFGVMLLMGMFLLGCSADTAPKSSHFEHDHFIAPHWPNDLADAAVKIRERLAWLQDGQIPDSHDHDHDHEHAHEHQDEHEHDDDHDHEVDPKAEIIEIVSWIPEIAADTNLPEADWLPLYHATESLLANLHSADGELTDDNRGQLESLCELVDESVRKIPEFLPKLAKGAS